jgi:hypothetical protein
MKSCWILFLCLSCLGAGGCSGLRQQQIAALERENSQLNGLLWEMEFQLESLEQENGQLKQRLATAEDDDQVPAQRRSSAPRKSTEPAEAAPFDPGQFRPPVIEFPSESSPEGTIPDSLLPDRPGDRLLPMPGPSTSRQSKAPVAPAGHEEPALSEPKIEIVPPEEVSLDSSRIRRVALGPMIGTLHLDDKPGDDGLVIVVEPWDGSGQMLADAADVSVVLIDPAEPKETARYAQWQFEAKEAAKLFRDGDVPGLHLELPWPGDPPRHDRLHLFVRYTTSDGRKLETDTLVEVELGGRGRWVSTETPRVRPYEQTIVPSETSPTPPATPQLLAADSGAAVPKPVSDSSPAPVRTISMARDSSASGAQPEANVSVSRQEPKRHVARAETRPVPIPLPAPEPLPQQEPPRRRRPVWSPDRPW